MFVRWQWWGDRRRGSERRYCRDIADAHAILVESTRVDGKPRQRHVAYLGSVHNVYREQTPYYRAKFWQHMRAKLDSLHNRISSADRRKIEAALAEKVPPLPADEAAAILRKGGKSKSSHTLAVVEAVERRR
jgi:hypothetical protein